MAGNIANFGAQKKFNYLLLTANHYQNLDFIFKFLFFYAQKTGDKHKKQSNISSLFFTVPEQNKEKSSFTD